MINKIDISSNKIILESLSMDLLRVALGLHRGSPKMAQRFEEEAMERAGEIKKQDLKPYLINILTKVEASFRSKPDEKKAEEALMYSTLIRNYCQTYLK